MMAQTVLCNEKGRTINKDRARGVDEMMDDKEGEKNEAENVMVERGGNMEDYEEMRERDK